MREQNARAISKIEDLKSRMEDMKKRMEDMTSNMEFMKCKTQDLYSHLEQIRQNTMDEWFTFTDKFLALTAPGYRMTKELVRTPTTRSNNYQQG
jgi:hypothetical protein